MKGTAAEILHHLLLTERRGKSPIRLWKVKLVALTVQLCWRRAAKGGTGALCSAAAATGVGFCAHRRRFGASSARCVCVCAGWVGVLLPSVLTAELRVHPSAQSRFLGVRLLNVERGKTSTSYRIWCRVQGVKQRHPVERERGGQSFSSSLNTS